jgi:hypothetical protein
MVRSNLLRAFMTKKVAFKIAYDGEALRDHSMDVRDLAPALLSLGKLFDAANLALNGDKAEVRLQVKAHSAGSFEVALELFQSFGSQVSHLLTGDFVTSVLNLKDLIVGGGGLFWLIKILQGKKPDKIEHLAGGMVSLELQGETIVVPLALLRLYQDTAIRIATEEVLKPLYHDKIDKFIVKDNDIITEEVTKADIHYFTLPEIRDEIITENTHEAAYSIISLAFKDDNKWRLHDGNSTINVQMKDDIFRRKVEENLISFSKGDILRCKVKTTQWRTGDGLKTEYEVLEVVEHIPAAKQMLLFKDNNNKII